MACQSQGPGGQNLENSKNQDASSTTAEASSAMDMCMSIERENGHDRDVRTWDWEEQRQQQGEDAARKRGRAHGHGAELRPRHGHASRPVLAPLRSRPQGSDMGALLSGPGRVRLRYLSICTDDVYLLRLVCHTYI
jgi:hypothetical protein